MLMLLLISHLFWYFPESWGVWWNFPGLFYPIILLGNLLLLPIWWKFRKPFKYLPIIILLWGIPQIHAYLPLNLPTLLKPGKPSLKVLSFNVMNLSKNNEGHEDSSIRKSIFKLIADQEADVICAQDFRLPIQNYDILFQQLQQQTHCPYLAFESYQPQKSKRVDGLLILSKFPILQSGYLQDSTGKTFLLQAEIRFRENTIQILNVHLESYHMAHIQDTLTQQHGLLGKITHAFHMMEHSMEARNQQFLQLYQTLCHSREAVVLCGDLNEVPNSEIYHRLSSLLQDTYAESGFGFDYTYHDKFPFLRIDYIFKSSQFNSFHPYVVYTELSDHHAVGCQLQWK